MTGTVLFIAVGNPVRAVFIGANGETEQITVSIAVRLIWEGTESEETAACLRSGVFRETNEILSTYKTTTILTESLVKS